MNKAAYVIYGLNDVDRMQEAVIRSLSIVSNDAQS